MARLLNEKGYKDVWPLLGGLESWIELGYPVDRDEELVPFPVIPVAQKPSR